MLGGERAQQGQGAGESFSAIGHSPILGTALPDDLGSLLEFVEDNLGIRREIGPSPATSRLRSRCVDGSLDLLKRFALGHQIVQRMLHYPFLHARNCAVSMATLAGSFQARFATAMNLWVSTMTELLRLR